MSLTNCRFYEEKYPDIDSFVMVNVSASTSAAVTTFTNVPIRSNKYARFPSHQPTARADDKCKIAEMGAYVKLLEYDNIDGMILLSELSRRRIRSIQKLIRVGRNEVVVVLRVDKEKGARAGGNLRQ